MGFKVVANDGHDLTVLEVNVEEPDYLSRLISKMRFIARFDNKDKPFHIHIAQIDSVPNQALVVSASGTAAGIRRNKVAILLEKACVVRHQTSPDAFKLRRSKKGRPEAAFNPRPESGGYASFFIAAGTSA